MPPSITRPYAITMWDFSWLERRWPGAGYEDWDVALGELAERGYDAVRIDAYPHLVSADPDRVWHLVPVWDVMSWGAQSACSVQVLPALLDFIRAARRHGIAVALSSWYRRDRDDVRMRIRTPADQARIWVDVLRHLEDADLLDAIVFVDLCNEFPLPVWTPYLYDEPEAPGAVAMSRTDPRLVAWMQESLEAVRAAFPDLAYTYSTCAELTTWRQQDVSALDLLEPHVWMASEEAGDFYDRVGYGFERFASTGFDNLARRGRATYEADPAHWTAALTGLIDEVAAWSRATGKGLWTTECWSVVDYKDWPGLDWDWVLDLNARGVEHAAATGRWLGMATSNFCGPQFVGVWREVAHHQRLTALIKGSTIDPDLIPEAPAPPR